jgi:primosomal protein N' (replication factor Y)
VGAHGPRGRAPARVRVAPIAPDPDRFTPTPADVLSGPVDVCVAVPRLSLDRPFTYLLDQGAGAGIGSLVSVGFHGRTVKGWVLGEATDVPRGRLLPVRAVRSPVRFFDAEMLNVLRWTGERYLAPLSTVIERSHPPRVASEETGDDDAALTAAAGGPAAGIGGPDGDVRVAGLDLQRLLTPGATSWFRPLPQDEVRACVVAVGACLDRGRRALVLVPEADPLPATASAVLHAFGPRAVSFVGGSGRARYRTWLRIRSGAYDVVVGTRPAAFAPLAGLGLVWVSREVHPAHQEDRAPRYHPREVAAARARIQGAACVLASLSPSVETAAAAAAGRVRVCRPARQAERDAAPLVETVPPEAEDRSTRLGTLLKGVRSAALIASRRGYGIARVCRTCGEAAACAVCRGPIVVERGAASCRVCEAPGRCAGCGGASFGVERGGVERVAEWAGRLARVPVVASEDPAQARPGDGVLVGTAAAVHDAGPQHLDLVAILDPDRALSRPGWQAGEQALGTWMEAAAWAGPRGGGGRVLVQTRRAEHPAMQALIRWEPTTFLRLEAERRTQAGFPPATPAFRMAGPSGRGLEDAVRSAGAASVLATEVGSATVCLVAVRPERLPAFRREILRLAGDGVVERVDAEPLVL